MSRIRVLDLAKELNLETKIAIVKLQEIGVQVKNHFNAISDIEADKMRAYVRSGKNPEKEAATKASSKVVIRRRSAESAAGEGQGARTDEGAEQQPESAAVAAPARAAEGAAPVAAPMGEPAAVRARAETATAGPAKDEREAARAEAPAAKAAVAKTADKKAAEPAAEAKPSPSISEQAPLAASADTAPQVAQSAAHAPVASSLSNDQDFDSTPSSNEANSNLPSTTSASPGTLGAPVVRPAQPAPAAPPVGSATIVRRAEPQPAPQSAAHSTQGGAGGYQPRAAGDRSAPGQDRPAGAFPARPGGFQRSEGGYQRSSDSSYQRPEGAGNYTRPEGGFQPSPGGFQPTPGGYQRTEGGGYQRGAGGEAAGGYRPGASPVYHAGADAGQRPAWTPRPPGGAPGGTGGYTPGGAPRPAGAPGTGYGGAPRPGGYGAPRPGGAPVTGGGRAPFAMPEAPATGKETPMRTREKEKEHEARRRRLAEEEELRRSGKTKGRHGEDEFLEEGDENAEPTAEGEVPLVRTVIPNRRRGSFSSTAARKKEMRRAEAANPTKQSKKIVGVDENISVSDLAGEMSVKSSAVIKALMQLGMMASVNQILDVETATLVAQDFGFEVQNKTVSISDILNTKKTDKTDTTRTEIITRPPIITIMGHVDHGKTSLLDAIRSTKVASGEAGGITQHIGAYQIEYNGREITFLDTPGHEAFTQMRARGAQVTDVVILVVAADDGVMPQTVEAIAHAKAAKVPIIVAVNKMDKPGASVERIQRELAQHNVTPEEWGGESMFVPVSAKTQEGIPELLETILLQADVLDLKAPVEGLASGIVVEAKLDKSRGPVATLLVTNGTLKQSDWVVVGRTYGRVRAMVDDKGRKLTVATPAMPVEIIGLSEVPAAGDSFNCVVNDAIAKEAVSYRIEKQRQKDMASQQKTSVEDFLSRLGDDANRAKELGLIVKADTHGSMEAIRASIKKLDTEKVKTKVIHSAVGGITETDISLAQASNALVVGFNVRPDRMATQVAEQSGIEIQVFSIIYELIDSVQHAMAGKLAPVKTEKIQGHAEVRSLFSVPKIGVIAGSAITDGKFMRNAHVRVVRDSVVIYTGRVSSLKRFKDDAKEVVQGFECGIGVENYNDLKVGDVLESFIIEEVAATLN